MGARGGFVAPDEVTFEYLKDKEYAPKGAEWDKAVSYWKTLKSGDDAVFDKELVFDAKDIEPRVTYGTNPGMGIGITEAIPTNAQDAKSPEQGFRKALSYMGFEAGEKLLGKKIDYVFLGACTNGRIEDFRAFASIAKGRKKADNVVAWLVPGSWAVDRQIREEGLDKVLEAAGGLSGHERRQSACRQVCRQYVEPQLRRSSRPRLAHHPLFATGSRCSCRHRSNNRSKNTMKQKFNIITSTCVPLPLENVDTDQIIPARFLKATTREESFFGDNLFRDWRYNSDGTLNKNFVLNDPTYSGCILVAGKNFGNGSSREHAAWAIAGYGFRVVISSFFADIHKNNELNNFVLPVVVSEPFLKELFDSIKQDPKTEVEVDLPNQRVTNKATGKSETFEINGYKKHCLMNGLDDIDFLVENKDKIEAWEQHNK